MTKPTAQEIAGAFYQREKDARYFINDEHPHAAAAKACRDAIAASYGYDLGAMDWSYQAAAEILGYGVEPTEDNAHEIADSLTDIYNNDLREWFYEYPTVAETAEEEARDYAAPDTTLTGRIQQAQYIAYGNAAAAVAQVLAELDDDDDEETYPAYLSPDGTRYTIRRSPDPTNPMWHAIAEDGYIRVAAPSPEMINEVLTKQGMIQETPEEIDA